MLGLANEAEQAFLMGRTVLEGLVKEYPQTPSLRYELAILLGYLSGMRAMKDGCNSRWKI